MSLQSDKMNAKAELFEGIQHPYDEQIAFFSSLLAKEGFDPSEYSFSLQKGRRVFGFDLKEGSIIISVEKYPFLAVIQLEAEIPGLETSENLFYLGLPLGWYVTNNDDRPVLRFITEIGPNRSSAPRIESISQINEMRRQACKRLQKHS